MNIVKNRSGVNLKILFLLLSLFVQGAYAQDLVKTVQSTEITRDSVMKNKLFYFFTVIGSEVKRNKALKRSQLLKEISEAQSTRVAQSLKDCKSGKCYAESIRWSDREIGLAGTELMKLLKSKRTRNRIVEKLKASGHYNLYHDLSDTAFIRTVWENNANGINRIFHVYLGGNPPKRYARIDSISYRHDHPVFVAKVDSALLEVMGRTKNREALFFEFPLEASLAILYINGRDEVARYEPLTAGYNLPSFEQAKNIDWSSYKYSVLLVPGSGPQEAGVRMTEKGMDRCRMAAKRFNKGLAPFIVVSGGHVYPFRTPICEAVEMRKYMIEELNIPQEAIIIEPHARHTTTNIRNATRLMYRFDMPDTKAGLVITDTAQIKMIENLAPRCIRELGYVPYKQVNALNENEIEFIPSIQSLQINLEDVLDP